MTPRSQWLFIAALSCALNTVSAAQVNYVRDCLMPQASDRRRTPSAACRAEHAYEKRSVSMYLEQDFLQKFGPTSDRNYTMGLGFARSGTSVTRENHDFALRGAELTLDWLSNHTIRPLSFEHVPESPIASLQLEQLGLKRAYAEMASGTAFTPKDLRAVNPVIGDRPYSFLLGWTVSRTTPFQSHSYTSSLTLGMIGSRLGRNVQRFIHHTSRALSGDSTPFDPKGWHNQIMDVPSIWFGIPTARYGLSRSDLLLDQEIPRKSSSWFDLASDVDGEIGYYTDADVGLRGRLGLFSIPYWAWRQDPLTAGSRGIGGSGPLCLDLRVFCLDGFAYGGAKLRAIGYNALLQGYPRYPGYHVTWSDRRYFGTEVSSGVATTLWFGASRSSGLQLVYELYAYRSAEYSGQLQSSHTWGGIYLTYLH